jgi:hypothetical protein
MTETKTIVTTEEVEMVECSSCGQEIKKDEAHCFMVKNTKYKDDSSGQTEGWACEHCVERPISYPTIKLSKFLLGEVTDSVKAIFALMLLSFLLGVVITPIFV